MNFGVHISIDVIRTLRHSCMPPVLCHPSLLGCDTGDGDDGSHLRVLQIMGMEMETEMGIIMDVRIFILMNQLWRCVK